MQTGEPTAVGASDQELATDQEVGEFRVECVLGRGGFGTVYRAVHPLIGKQVAIKVLARRYAADPDIVSRFVSEARAVNQIRHRNIIDIFAFGQLADGRHYYVMECLEGMTLEARLKQGPLPLAEALPILHAIARALDAAHAKGIAHRDLKPENIFLASDDEGTHPKLLDFGIAKLLAPEGDVRHRTNTGIPIGTPYYMSPEQCRGRDVDHRTDVYSFGIVAFRALTGTYPFEGDDYMELLVKQMNEEPPLASSRNRALPPSCDAAIAWMMHKDPAKRPATVVDGFAAIDPETVVKTPSIPRLSRPVSRPAVDPLAMTTAPEVRAAAPRPRRWWIGGLVVAVAGVAILLVVTRLGSRVGESAKPVSVVAADAAPAPAIPAPPIVAPAPPIVAPPSDTVAITFLDVPPGAVVTVDGKPIDATEPHQVERGSTVKLVITAPGYQRYTKDYLAKDNTTFPVAMTPQAPRAVPVDHHGTEAPAGFKKW